MASSKGQRAVKGRAKPARKAKTKKTRPVFKARAGRLSCAIFINAGDSGSFYSINPQRVYTDANGETANSNSLNESDLPTMQALLAECWEFCRANPLDGEDYEEGGFDDDADDGRDGDEEDEDPRG